MNRLPRTTLYLLPLTGVVLALTGGPVPSALSADYSHRQAERTKAKQPEQQKKSSSTDDRTISSFMAPTIAKPADHDSSGNSPILTDDYACRLDALVICDDISVGNDAIKAQLHLPIYRAHAPPAL